MIQFHRGPWVRYAAVSLVAAAGVGMLTASLVAGDSVRFSLASILGRRTGKASFAITAPRFFAENLGAEVARAGAWNWCPAVVLDGWIAGAGGSAGTIPVTVFGIDSRFFTFHGRSLAAPAGTEAYISPQLAATLGMPARKIITLRFAKPSPVPPDWLFGPKASQALTLPVTIAGTRSAADLGNFSLNPNQPPGASIFVPLALLQKELQQPDHVNTILVSTSGQRDESAALAQALRERAGPEDLGIRIEEPDGSLVAIEADSIIMPDELVHEVTTALSKLDVPAKPVSSYLAISITAGSKSVAYSFVAAIDSSMMPVEDGSVVLNDWTAHQLAVRPGDTIHVTVPVWDRGALSQNIALFRLDRVVPLRGAAGDPDLTPEFPGIVDVETMLSWRAPFPLDRTLVHTEDEAYWKRYGAVPKAFISPAAAAKLWGGRFGHVTSIRADLRSPMTTDEDKLASLRAAIRAETDPLKLGYWIRPIRAANFDAARMPADLFLYCATFPVAASFMLLFMLLRGVVVRTAIVLSLVGTAAGVAAAPSNSALMLDAVRRWWPEAIRGVPVSAHVSLAMLAYGGAAGFGIACFCAVLAAQRSRRKAGWRFAAVLLAVTTFLPIAAAALHVPPSVPGAYNVIAEASAPIILHPADASQRRALGLPEATWYALRLQPGEDVSRRNLFRPQSPTVAGAPQALIDAMQRRPGWKSLNATLQDGSMPTIADRFSLAAVLHDQAGDTVVLNPAADQPTRLRITGTMHEPALQDLLIMNETDFLRAFPSSNGYRLLLAQAAHPEEVARSTAAALGDYGVTAQTVSERISSYHAVDDAYVAAFQVFGALAFLIGSAAFGIQARRAAGHSEKPVRVVLARTALSITTGIVVAAAALVPALLSGLQCADLVRWVPALAGAGVILALASAQCESATMRSSSPGPTCRPAIPTC